MNNVEQISKRLKDSTFIKNPMPKRPVIRSIAARMVVFVVFASFGAALQYYMGSVPGSVEGIQYFAVPVIIAVSLIMSVRKMEEWDRAIVLRLGKFHSVRGPGIFFLIPIIDRVAQIVDLRIRVSDFTAETTLTRDSVTVTVDALCFWLVWDAEKAVCEVQDYEDAVILSSKTALRNAISTHNLSVFLEENETIQEAVRSTVDKKTTEWGITIQYIEITDIQIPQHLQDSLSRIAQAEREKKARILVAESEIDIAHKYEDAARIYSGNDTALIIKKLAILNEGLKDGNSMMLVPNSITEKLDGKDIFGLQALNEIKKDKPEKTKGGDDPHQGENK